MRGVGEVVLRHIGGKAAFVDALQIFGLETALAAQERARLHLAGVVGDAGERFIRRSDTGRGERLVKSLDVVRIKRPDIAADDFAQQSVPIEQSGRRFQSQSHVFVFSLCMRRRADTEEPF